MMHSFLVVEKEMKKKIEIITKKEERKSSLGNINTSSIIKG